MVAMILINSTRIYMPKTCFYPRIWTPFQSIVAVCIACVLHKKKDKDLLTMDNLTGMNFQINS